MRVGRRVYRPVLHGTNPVSTMSSTCSAWSWRSGSGHGCSCGAPARGGSAASPAAPVRRRDWGGVLFPAALLLGLAAPVGVITGVTPPVGLLARPLVAVAGLVLGAAGVVVVRRAQSAMGTCWRVAVNDSECTASR